MDADALAELHAPLEPVMRLILVSAGLPQRGIVLDLACGAGLKVPLMAEVCGPQVTLVGLDWDRGAVGMFQESTGLAGIVGDALGLPLRDHCLDAAVCIAALGLFADPLRALRELRRVVYPGAQVVLVTSAQRWVRVIRWPDDLVPRLWERVAHAWICDPDIAEAYTGFYAAAGFATIRMRAFLLDAAGHPAAAGLPLLPWDTMRPLVAPMLSEDEIRRCADAAVDPDVELCELVIAVLGYGA